MRRVTNTLSATVPDITTGKGAISRFSVASDGTLTLLGQTYNGPGFPSDVVLSSDDLYVVDPTLDGRDTSYIEVYRVGADGSLTSIESTATTCPVASRQLPRSEEQAIRRPARCQPNVDR